MPVALAELLRSAVEEEAQHLTAVSEDLAATKRAKPGAWTRKEELGHLIDSASNNHIRFVRAALQPEFRGDSYQQDASVALHGYANLAWPRLKDLWRQYNLLLADLIANIPESKLRTPCYIGASAPVTLQFLIEDYVLHMRHHLDHILDRPVITQYPGAAAGV